MSLPDFLDDDLEAAVGSMGGNSLGTAPVFESYPPQQLPMALPGQMPGYYPVANYPLNGMGTGDTSPIIPFYKKPLVTFATGAVIVGAVWLYFDVIRPRMKKAKAKAEK